MERGATPDHFRGRRLPQRGPVSPAANCRQASVSHSVSQTQVGAQCFVLSLTLITDVVLEEPTASILNPEERPASLFNPE